MTRAPWRTAARCSAARPRPTRTRSCCRRARGRARPRRVEQPTWLKQAFQPSTLGYAVRRRARALRACLFSGPQRLACAPTPPCRHMQGHVAGPGLADEHGHAGGCSERRPCGPVGRRRAGHVACTVGCSYPFPSQRPSSLDSADSAEACKAKGAPDQSMGGESMRGRRLRKPSWEERVGGLAGRAEPAGVRGAGGEPVRGAAGRQGARGRGGGAVGGAAGAQRAQRAERARTVPGAAGARRSRVSPASAAFQWF